GDAGERRARSPHLRIFRVDGGRRSEGRHCAWRDRRDRLPRGGRPALRHRRSCNHSSPVGTGLAQAGDTRSQTAGWGPRKCDQGDHRVKPEEFYHKGTKITQSSTKKTKESSLSSLWSFVRSLCLCGEPLFTPSRASRRP